MSLRSPKAPQKSRIKANVKKAILQIKIFGRFAQNQWLLMGSPQKGARGIKKPGVNKRCAPPEIEKKKHYWKNIVDH